MHRPDKGGPYPVLVQRTRYGKSGNFDRYVKAGYIVVVQDVRGLYASEGEAQQGHDPWRTGIEAEDGYDTVEWAAKLPGSTGKVGTFGASALAGYQWKLASLGPPSLVVMVARSMSARQTDQFPSRISRPYVILKSRMVIFNPERWRRLNLPGVHTEWEAIKLWDEGEAEKWVNFLPWNDLPIELTGFQSDDNDLFFAVDGYNEWKLYEDCKDVPVPNLDITGWYDHCNNDILFFRTMVREAKTEVARENSRIIIGPWSHASSGSRRIGSFDFGRDAVLDKSTVEISWFDYWLKGKQNGVDKEAPVRIFVMGDNKWRDEQAWPLQRARDRVLFLTSRGHANTPSGDGKLVQREPGQMGKDQYLYDPEDPVPTLFDPMNLLFPIDLQPLANREDILVYQSEPLIERMEVTGNPVVELYAESSAPDTDWFVRLIDIDPSGLTRNISEGVVRARYREGLDKPKFLKTGEVVKYVIRMKPTSNAFLSGHRIRLDITSSDFPNYARNHNTTANQNADATFVIARQTIYHGGEQATRIILPWIPNQIEEEKVEQEPVQQFYFLHRAVTNGDLEQIRRMISNGADVNEEDERGNTPLRNAIVRSGNMEIVTLLVEAGADINAGSQPSLCIAVDEDNIAIAEYLIAHGANIDAPAEWAPLVRAPYSSGIEMIKLLIARGADVDAGPWTALHSAVDEGRRDIIELLIQNGADINIKNEESMTPLDLAFFLNRKDIAELLLAKSTHFGSKNDRGLTALHNAAVEDYQDLAKLLLSNGAKVDERDNNYEFTALHYTARFGNIKVAEVLIAHGADIRAKDKWDYEPIHWAAYHDRPEIIELLIAHGADVNAITSLGQTPIQLAIPRRNTAAIEVLKKNGATE